MQLHSWLRIPNCNCIILKLSLSFRPATVSSALCNSPAAMSLTSSNAHLTFTLLELGPWNTCTTQFEKDVRAILINLGQNSGQKNAIIRILGAERNLFSISFYRQ